MLKCSTLASEMRILCIRKHLTIDPCYDPLYYEMPVLIDNMCLRLFYAYGWLLVVSLDNSVETNLMIWEACCRELMVLLPFQKECHFSQKNCFKMNVTLHFQYNFNFFLSTLPSINTPTFPSHNFQCNFKFVFLL